MIRPFRPPLVLFALALAAGAAFAADPPPAAKSVTSLQTGFRPWKGDFDKMAERRIVRALVPYSKTFCYVE